MSHYLVRIEEENIGDIWFQQERTCHTATLHVLRFVFEDRIISCRADVWPPRNCDLIPLDYYLWAAAQISVSPTSQTQLTL